MIGFRRTVGSVASSSPPTGEPSHTVSQSPSLPVSGSREPCSRGYSRLTRTDAFALAGFLLFLLLFFSNVLFLPGEICLGRPDGDGRNQFYGWRAYGFGEVRAGRFPLWNPYEFMGMPFVASLQSAMFYPTNWLCAILPLGRAINLGILINLFLSGLFTYLWCRRIGLRWPGALAAAGAYVFGAPQVMRIFEGHWSFLCPMPWIPCVFLCIEVLLTGRMKLAAVSGGAAAVAMQLFGGNPQYAFYGGIAAVMYLVARAWQERSSGLAHLAKATGCFAAMYGLGVLLAGVQLIPALELLSRSTRQGQLSYEWIGQYSLVPESLVTFLVPDFFGSDIGAQYWGRWNLWEMSPYVGVITVVLAIMAAFSKERRTALLACGMAAVLFILALGKHTRVLLILYQIVPGFDLFRAQARFLCPFTLFAALLAGLGLDAISGKGAEPVPEPADSDNVRLPRLRKAVWGIGAVALLLGALGLFLTPESEWAADLWQRFMGRVIAAGFPERLYLLKQRVTADFVVNAMRDASMSLIRSAVFLGALAILLTIRVRIRLRPAWIIGVVLALMAVDFWGFGRRYLKTFDPRADAITPGAVAFLKKSGEPFRWARGGDFALPPCEGMTHRIACIEGVQPNAPARFRDVFWSIQGEAAETQRTSYSIFRLVRPYRAFRMLNLRYFVQYRSNPRTAMAGLRTVYEDERIRIDGLPNSWPRAWLVHGYEVVPDGEEVLRRLMQFDCEETVLFQEEPGVDVTPASGPEPRPQFVLYEPGRIKLNVEAAGSGFLVLSDLHYPGWTAQVDGRPTEVLRANYLMRAVHIPAGEHEVEFIYRPLSFTAGLWSSGLGALACAVLFLLSVVRRRGEDNT